MAHRPSFGYAASFRRVHRVHNYQQCILIRYILTDGHPAPRRMPRPPVHVRRLRRTSLHRDPTSAEMSKVPPDDDVEPTTSLIQRTLSPDHSPTRATTPGGIQPLRATRPKPEYDPCQIPSPSRPGTTPSNYHDHDGDGRESRTMSHASFRTSALRTQIPRATLRLRAHLLRRRKWKRSSSTNNSPA
jgi:hypothetical protein